MAFALFNNDSRRKFLGEQLLDLLERYIGVIIRENKCGVFENFFDPSGDTLWGLVIKQIVLHEGPQLLVQSDFLALETVLPQSDIRKLLGVCRIVSFFLALLLELIPDAAFVSFQDFRDICERVFFLPKYFNLAAISIGETEPFCFFIPKF